MSLAAPIFWMVLWFITTWCTKIEQPTGGTGRYVIFGGATVGAGQFAFDADVMGWPAGDVRILTRFDPEDGNQPPDVVVRYGSYGSRLDGPDVYGDSGTRFLAVITHVKLTP